MKINYLGNFLMLNIHTIISLISKKSVTRANECITNFQPQLIPANMPEELKSIVYYGRGTEISDFIRLVLNETITKRVMNSKQENILCGKFPSFLNYFLKLMPKIKSLNNVMQSTTLVHFSGPRKFSGRGKLGKTFVLSSPGHGKIENDFFYSHVTLIPPFGQNINLTFIPLDKSEACPFILCVEGYRRSFWTFSRACAIFASKFIPWTIITRQLRVLFLKMTVNLLYSEYSSCAPELLKIIYQPTSLRLTLYNDYEPRGVYNHYYHTLLSPRQFCRFYKQFRLLTFEHLSYGTLGVYTMRIAVHVNQQIVMKLSSRSMKLSSRPCNTKEQPMYIYDGPGVLSHQLKCNTTNEYIKATTFQVFILNVASTSLGGVCILHFQGKKYDFPLVSVSNKTVFHHWKYTDTSRNNSYCKQNNQITVCGLQATAEENLVINVTRLTGIKHLSFSGYELDFHLPNTAMYNNSVGLCYYGMLSVGYWSFSNKMLKHNITNLCGEQETYDQEIWLSSKSRIDIMLYSYYPYSSIETKFYITSSKCESVTISLCMPKLLIEIASTLNGKATITSLSRIAERYGSTVKHTDRYKIAIDDGCFAMNLVMGHGAHCVSYRFNIQSRSSIVATGYTRLYYYHWSGDSKPFLESSSGKIYFDKKSYFPFSFTEKLSFIEYDLSHDSEVRILNLISAIKVTVKQRKVDKTSHLQLSLANKGDLSALIRGSDSKCYKLNLAKLNNTALLLMKTSYHGDILMKKGSLLKETFFPEIMMIQNYGSFAKCALMPGISGTDEFGGGCHIADGALLRIYSCWILVHKEVHISKKSPAVYIDNDIVLKDRPIKALTYINDITSSNLNSMTLEEQKPFLCYNLFSNNIQSKLPAFFVEDSVVVISTTEYQAHYYEMRYKVKGGITGTCYSLLTCSKLESYVSDLVSWEYADANCKKSGMTLLTVGSKEEELAAVSLQTYIGSDGTRYETQFVYLGLIEKGKGIFKWQDDNTPASYFQWNEFHFPMNVSISYHLVQNSEQLLVDNNNKKCLNNVKHWNKQLNGPVNDSCTKFFIPEELLVIQPNAEKNYRCAASVLGDMRHSDWIKVPCNCPLTSSWICEKQPEFNTTTNHSMLYLKNSCQPGEFYFNKSCLLPQRLKKISENRSFCDLKISSELNFYLNMFFMSHKSNVIITEPDGATVIYTKCKSSEEKEVILNYFLYINDALTDRLSFSCSSGFFYCHKSNEQCIAPQFVCDNDFDCPDGEDEENCECNENVISNIWCLTKRFHHSLQKEMLHWNTEMRYRNMKDLELHVSILSQSVMQWEVQEEGKLECIPGHHLSFDFHEMCLFDRKENGLPSICPYGLHLKDCKYINCTNSLKCLDSYCVPYRNICDGKWDCPNGDDEKLNCHDLACPGFFHCKNLSVCLHPSELCDGKIDCRTKYMDDEIMCLEHYFCPQSCECLSSAIQCNNASLQNVPQIFHENFEYLFFSFNFVTALSKNIFYDFSSLQYLNLSFNRIDRIFADTFSKMKLLHTLDLTGNQMKYLRRNQFCGLVSSVTMYLYITLNKLEEIHEWAFSGMSHLNDLNLCCMSISVLKEYSFANVTNLQFLNLSGNKIRNLRANLFQKTKLSTLDISRNSISTPLHFLQYLLTIDKIITSSRYICCLVSKHVSQCVYKNYDENINPECVNKDGFLLILLRFFVVGSFVTNLSVFCFYIKIRRESRVAHFIIPAVICFLLIINVLFTDLNNVLTSEVLQRYVNQKLPLCSFTRLFTNGLFLMVYLNFILNSVDGFVLTYFPFRRKGLSVNSSIFAFALGSLISMIFSLASLTLEASKTLLAHDNLSYTTCVPILTDSLFHKSVILILLGLGYVTFTLLKLLIVYKLLIKKSLGEQQSGIKTKFGIHNIVHVIVFSLFWLPVLLIFAIPSAKKHKYLLSEVILLLTLLSIIASNVLFTFLKKDFRESLGFKERTPNIVNQTSPEF